MRKESQVFGSSWRRRMKETVGQTIGVYKVEVDGNTPMFEDETKEFMAAAEALEELEKAFEQVVLSHVGTRQAVLDLTASADGTAGQSLRDCDRARKMHVDVLRMCLESYVTPLRNQGGEVASVMKEYKDQWCKDYWSRKRTKSSIETKASKAKDASKYEDDVRVREIKFEHSKNNARTMADYLRPLLIAFVAAAKDCQTNAVRCLAAADLYVSLVTSEKLGAWAAGVQGPTEAPATAPPPASGGPRTNHSDDPVVRLLAGLDDARRRPTPGPPAWPGTKTQDALGSLLKNKPKLQSTPPELAGVPSVPREGIPSMALTPEKPEVKKMVYGATLTEVDSPPVIALEAMLAFLEAKGGFEREGLFRIPGNSDDVNDIKADLDTCDECTPSLVSRILQDADLDDVATLTKMWFRELSEPILDPFLDASIHKADTNFPPPPEDDTTDDSDFASDVAKALIHPSTNPASAHCLVALLTFLSKVAEHSKVNMMTPKNLAVCFAPNIFPSNDPSGITNMNTSISLCARLISAAPLLAAGTSEDDVLTRSKSLNACPPSLTDNVVDYDDDDDPDDVDLDEQGAESPKLPPRSNKADFFFIDTARTYIYTPQEEKLLFLGFFHIHLHLSNDPHLSSSPRLTIPPPPPTTQCVTLRFFLEVLLLLLLRRC